MKKGYPIRHKKLRIFTILKYAFLILMTFICLFPIYFAVVSSFKSTSEIFASMFSLPQHLSFNNYTMAWKTGNLGRYFVNTVYLTSTSLIILVVIGSMAAYVLCRYEFKFQNSILMFFVSGMMIPMQSVIIPLAFNLGALQIRNSYTILILLYVAFQLPMTIFIFSGFMRGIPRDLEEAAMIDGCNASRIYAKVILPLSTPAIVTATIFNFINIWNNLLFPLVFITDKNKQVISYGLLTFFSQWKSDYGGVMAAITLSILPCFLIYILLQERVEQGMTAGAVKG